MIYSIPNIITYFRFLVVPIFLFLYFSENKLLICISIVLYLFGALSDYFDGYFARKLNSTSSFGKFLDPLADKFIVLASLFAFVYQGIIPLWMVLVIFGRDIITTYMRRLSKKKNHNMQTSKLAKWKTFAQFLFIGYVQTLVFVANSGLFDISLEATNEFIYSSLTYFMMLILVLYTLFTLVDYIIINKIIFK